MNNQRDYCKLNQDDVIECFIFAFKCLNKYDSFLIAANAHEQAIAHRIALYMSEYLCDPMKNDLRVDVEYNRSGNNIKSLNDDSIRPDIIYHVRGTNKYNLICCEAKKHSVNNHDFKKLENEMSTFTYKFAVLITTITNDYSVFYVIAKDNAGIEITVLRDGNIMRKY